MKKYIRQNTRILVLTILLGVLYSGISSFLAVIFQQFLDTAVAGDVPVFIRLVVFTVAFVIVCGLLHLTYTKLGKKLVCRIIGELRYDVFNGVFKRNISDFKSVNSADYISALTNDIKLVEENYCLPLLQALLSSIELIASVTIMIVFFSPIIFIVLVLLIIMMATIPGIFNKLMEKRQSQFSSKMSDLTIMIKDFMSGFEVIKSYRMHPHIEQSFYDNNKTTTDSKYALDGLTALVESVSMVLGYVVSIIIFTISAFLILIGRFTVGQLGGILQVTGQIIGPIQILSQSIPKIKGTKAVIKRLTDLIEYQNTTLVGDKQPTFTNDIVVKDVHFNYANGNGVLRGVNCRFEKNRKYAIIGKSGCGKTTLINLINGYYGQYEGEILFDNIDLHDLNIEQLNEMIAVIHQGVYMFDESIYNNICLHKELPKDHLASVLTMSGVTTFLDDSRNLQTGVGENGANLSGGQKQRIAVARALAQNKPILILDEGTSAIDLQTAVDIESRLLSLDNLTVITITHSFNPGLLRAYDNVLFMENGTCISGTFDELLNKCEAFNEFFMLNKDKEAF